MPLILNMGSINIDYVYGVPHFVQAGETLSSTSRQIFPGGKGLNQSIALARAGANVTHAGIIGSDDAQLLEIFEEAGVDISLIAKSDGPSGHTVIQVTPEGENCILLFPGANHKIDERFVERTISAFAEDDILLLQNEITCVGHAMRTAKAQGMKIAFNPSPFSKQILDYPLELVDWWLLNEIEGCGLTGKNEPQSMLEAMQVMYPGAGFVLTLGQDGVVCRCGAETYSHGIFPVEVVDTTAAGDTFTGYFISAIAEEVPIQEAIELASKAASISVSRQGAATSIPTMDEVVTKI